ncbi:MAG: ATP-binding protein, partial [Polyangiaceae bacterium]
PHIAKVEKHARLAHSIVDDLMLLARGHVRWAEPVLLTDILTAARSDLSPSGAPDVALWKDDVTPADLRIGAHPGLSTRLLHALYENAIHASAPRVPRITTRARAESERVVVEVGDDGPGIPPQLAARIFDPLVTARPGGTGLGLALARRIAAAHGGTVELLESREGAHFRIELPRTA